SNSRCHPYYPALAGHLLQVRPDISGDTLSSDNGALSVKAYFPGLSGFRFATPRPIRTHALVSAHT
ncbi:MAG: hypothetical protein WBC55_10125, partial [Dehalococcoidia bacterium]